MSCKQPWEDQHVRANVSHTIVKRLSESTQKRLRDEEIAFMPETQMYVEYGRAVETVKVEEYLNTIRKKHDIELDLATRGIIVDKKFKTPADKKFKSDTQEELRLVENHASDIRFQISRWRNGMHLSRLFKDIIPEPLYVKEFGTQPAAGVGEERESHVMCPCPADDCRGFVTRRNNQCGVCGVKVCHRCLQTEEDDDIHTCDEEHVQSAELILATTKPCPKCASRIHKIEGCDQMWCTNCNTPFSWKSGKEIVGRTIHNPHFYEWTRGRVDEWTRQQQQEQPRRQLAHCEGLPDFEHVSQHLDVVFPDATTPTYNFVQMVSSTHRKCVHLGEVEITRDIDTTQFRTNLDARVQWLQNEITDAKFEKTLLRRHNQRIVQQHTNQVYGLVVTLCSDVFHRLLRENENTEQIRASYLAEFNEIAKYANTRLDKLEQIYKVNLRNIYF